MPVLAALVAVLAMVLIARAAGRPLPPGDPPALRGPAPRSAASAPPGPSGAARAGSAPPGPASWVAVGGLPETSPKALPPALDAADAASFSYYGGADASGMCLSDAPERHSVYASLSRLYSTADVDPLIAGNLYKYADGVRRVYSQRTSLEDRQGLTEYNSSAEPGDVGVDVGPFGLDTAPDGGGADDGVPENWRFPSTPVRWYRPRQRDFYGPEGATPYASGLYELREPDHDPKMP